MELRALFLLAVMFCCCKAAAITPDEAKAVAENFYKLLSQASGNIYPEHEINDKGLELKDRALALCADKEESLMPDEIDLFDEKAKPTGFKKANTYIDDYIRYAVENKSVWFKQISVGECISVSPVMFKSTDKSARTNYLVHVSKSVKAGDRVLSTWDMVSINGTTGKIIGIGNKGYGGYMPKDYQGQDYNLLISSAEYAYTTGDYDKAYDTYLKAKLLNPSYCEPYYRLALMIYYKKGINGRFKNAKERRRMLRQYLASANHNKGGSNYREINEDAYNVYYTLNNALV